MSDLESFAEFCRCDPSTLRAEVRAMLWRRYQAGTPVASSADKFKRELQIRYGDVDKAPPQDRARLLALESPLPGTPKPLPPVSVADMAKAGERELAILQSQLADMERPLAGESFNLKMHREREAQRIRDRISGIRRRAP